MKNKVQMIINTLLIIFMPFMMYVNISETKVNVAISDIMLLLVGLLFLINIKNFFLQKRWLYLLYFAGLVLSLLLSQYISQFNEAFLHVENSVMLMEIVKTLVVAMYFFTAFMFNKSEREYKLSLVAISLSSIPVMIIGLTSYIYFLLSKEFFIDTYKITKNSRFLGTFEDPNLCALFFIVIFFVSILNFKVIKNIFLRYLILGISVLSFIIILLTMSRGGWLAFAIAAIVLILLNIRNFKKESILMFISVVIIVLMSVNMNYYFQQGRITNDIIERIQDSIVDNGNDIDRVLLMKAAFKMGNDSFLFGVGKGSFSLNSYKYISEDTLKYDRQSIPHNTLLGFYAQQGIVGVLIFIMLPGFILYAIIKSRKKQNVYLIAVFVGICIHSMTINIENTRFIWYMLGLILAGEKMNINPNLVPVAKMEKRTFTIILSALLLLVVLSYVDVSRKLATNIYIYNGAIYDRKISVVEPGNYQLTFDIYTDNHLQSVEIYNGEELIKQMEFKSAYGVVQVPIHIEKECQVIFKSNEEGWMKVKNAYIVQGNKKVPLFNYVLLPRSVEEWLNKRDFLVYSERLSFKKQIVVEDNKFNAFEILEGVVTKYSNLSHVYQFDIKNKQKVNTDYQLELLLDYQSISYLRPDEYQRNIWTQLFSLYPYTTEWEEGQKYTVKTTNLSTSESFDLYGRYYDSQDNIYSQETYFPIHYSLVKEKQDIIELGESQWINTLYGKDKEDVIHITDNGWVESGRTNLQPGDYNITFKAQGSFLEEYSKVRIRDSELNEVAEITLDGNMKEYTVQYHVDEYKSGQSFILELINYEADKNGGNRQVLLKDWLKVDRKLG